MPESVGSVRLVWRVAPALALAATLLVSRAQAETPGVVAGNEVEVAAGAVHVDESRVRALRELEQYRTITAPFDGVVIERNVHPGALVEMLPPSALAQSAEGVFVARIRDGAVERVPVQRGSTAGDMVEVFGAIKEGDVIALCGTEELRTGTRVSLRVAESRAAKQP